jgi:hypothetical protein
MPAADWKRRADDREEGSLEFGYGEGKRRRTCGRKEQSGDALPENQEKGTHESAEYGHDERKSLESGRVD